jgi:hypothetical protein
MEALLLGAEKVSSLARSGAFSSRLPMKDDNAMPNQALFRLTDMDEALFRLEAKPEEPFHRGRSALI